MKTTTLRLRRVRFKDGRTIEVLRTRAQKPDTSVRDLLFQSTEKAIRDMPDIAGYALVVWSASGEIFVAYQNSQRSTVATGMTPQYVKDALLAEMAVRWSRD